jgi:hypothetical protein
VSMAEREMVEIELEPEAYATLCSIAASRGQTVEAALVEVLDDGIRARRALAEQPAHGDGEGVQE